MPKHSFKHCLPVVNLNSGGPFICLGCQTGKLDVAKKHNLRFMYYYHLYHLAVYITDSYILEGLLAFHCFCCLNPPIQHGVLFCMLRWKLFGLEGGAANMVCCLYFDDAKLQKKTLAFSLHFAGTKKKWRWRISLRWSYRYITSLVHWWREFIFTLNIAARAGLYVCFLLWDALRLTLFISS